MERTALLRQTFFAPYLLSCFITQNAFELHVSNESMTDKKFTVSYQVMNNEGICLQSDTVTVASGALSGVRACTVDLPDAINIYDTYITYALYVSEQEVFRAVELLCKPKHFEFKKPNISVCVDETARNLRFSFRLM